MILAYARRTFGAIACILALCSSAQQLQNTTWSVYDQGNLAFYMRFDGSVLSYSIDNTSYTPISNYTDNSGNFTLVDMLGSCAGITGTYTYIVDGDTLRWTLISDACPSRSDFFVIYDWATSAMGIAGTVGADPVVVFPNPTQGEVRISGRYLAGEPYVLCDGLGKAVSAGTFANMQATIDLAHLGPGTYILRVGSGTFAPLRVVKL
ncbi:MAG: T9SS type A sorting domain-containing protein [Flavobacteriales bacterium]